jgi:hypothetical protein
MGEVGLEFLAPESGITPVGTVLDAEPWATIAMK